MPCEQGNINQDELPLHGQFTGKAQIGAFWKLFANSMNQC